MSNRPIRVENVRKFPFNSYISVSTRKRGQIGRFLGKNLKIHFHNINWQSNKWLKIIWFLLTRHPIVLFITRKKSQPTSFLMMRDLANYSIKKILVTINAIITKEGLFPFKPEDLNHLMYHYRFKNTCCNHNIVALWANCSEKCKNHKLKTKKTSEQQA
jgi:hypothetical protein